jgi:anti-sigma regulatory factor (Ser/Thr protein kinase)
MMRLSFTHGIKPEDVHKIRQSVQEEAAALGLAAQQGFVMIFVLDELVCNVMEHGRAVWLELKLEADKQGFRCQMLDDGMPFDTAHEVRSAASSDLKGEDDRRIGLNLIGRLVDKVSYQRTSEGLNQVDLVKNWN